MDTPFVALLAGLLYAVATVARPRVRPGPLLGVILAAILCGALAIESAVARPGGFVLPLGAALALFGWLLSVAHLPLRRRWRLQPIDTVVWLTAAVMIPAGLLISTDATDVTSALSAALRVHIGISLLAWALLTLAALQTIAATWQSHRLRNHQTPAFDEPLMTMEQASFKLLGLGWILLLIGVASGFLFVDNFLTQHLAHKTAFTLLAAVLFGVLLLGRQLRGWRGDQALRWILAAWVMLAVGYAGVKWILESVLERSWS